VGRIKAQACAFATPETNRSELMRLGVNGGTTDPESARHGSCVDQLGGRVALLLRVALAQQLDYAHRECLYVLSVERYGGMF
jgi:hypothetical protein